MLAGNPDLPGSQRGAISASESQTLYGANQSSNLTKKGNASHSERGGTHNESLTKGVRFVLDRENCFLMELRVMEKDSVLLEQLDKEIKNNGDLNSSKYSIHITKSPSLQPDTVTPAEEVFIFF